MSIRLLTTNDVFDELVSSINWHDSYIRETHFSNAECRSGGREGSLLRILVDLPGEHCIEFIAFEPGWFRVWPGQEIDPEATSSIGRRKTEVDLGAFQIVCACLGYLKLPAEEAGEAGRYDGSPIFDETGAFCEPYNIDWRLIMDEARSGKPGNSL